MKLSGWGRFPSADCDVTCPRSIQDIRQAVTQGQLIARGMGRAYGDAALNTKKTLDMRHMNHMIDFDSDAGLLTVEAGVVLGDVISAFMPTGWFPTVTPGTKYVSIGGAIAADVHGKNHHKEGSFRNSVVWIDLMGPDGEIRRCSKTENQPLFEHTIGGMGLTGVILQAAIQLRPVKSSWIRQEKKVAANLDEVIAIFEETNDWTYSVAWLDCLARGASQGRSIVMLGEHATQEDLPGPKKLKPFEAPKKRKLTVPFNAPGAAINSFSIRFINQLYFHLGRLSAKQSLIDWDSYFYPLDAILQWNRIYGRKGFVQFQCVLPLETSREGLGELLDATAAAGQGSFLTVLKRFGKQDSPFSFPMEGYTLAIDFPVNKRSLTLLPQLDEITLAHGGRFYLAKDARLSSTTLENSDRRIEDFRAFRNDNDMAEHFSSLQSERLSL